ncbi:MAG TPA: Mur ligase family protein, partial [Stellaceae bacterium]|nr:Mur ligase family protein [Stellaceae bacterium]
MIDVTSFRQQRVAVMGLARSGLAAAEALKRGGAGVLAWDDSADKRAEATRRGLAVVDLLSADLADVKALVLSPGIPSTFPKPHPVAARARAAGIEIICDIELLARSQRAARFAGITGTNGKSTTTALLGHIVEEAGVTVQVGGNIGLPVLSLDPLGSDGLYVLEMSSYQLELTKTLVFDVALLLNITPDHLDRHGGMEGYIAAKERIFTGQTG